MSVIEMVSDSTAGLPPDYVTRHHISIVPLYIKMGDNLLREGIELNPDGFYEKLPHTNPLPTTSQPSVGDFAQVYQAAIERGASRIISVHLSAGISGTINSATLAAQQFPDTQIEIIDTRCASASHYFTVQAGVAALDAGASFDDAVARMRQVVDQQRTIFAVDTLEYLYKGGRIGGAAALLGSLLQMKPLLKFTDGKIDALERVRSSGKALLRMMDVLAEWVGTSEPQRVMVMEANCRERAEQTLEMLKTRLNVEVGEIMLLTPVIGAHAGPGTIGICSCPMSVCGPVES